MFANYKISKKIISNRDKLFILIFFDKLRKVLRIEERLFIVFYS